jgi:hypothetical protein
MLAPLLVIALILVLVLLGWFPFLHRRFSRDLKGGAVRRALVWSLAFIVPAFLVAEFTHRLPLGWIYPAAVLALPIPLNIIALIRYARSQHNA